MDRTHGGTATSKNKAAPGITASPTTSGRARRGRNTTVVDPSRSHTTTTTDHAACCSRRHLRSLRRRRPLTTPCPVLRVPGFGVITNIVNGGVECGHGSDSKVQDRIGFYKRYCDLLGVSYGDNLDCGSQSHF
ncbi:uncharacterized protein A4U43_C01F10780 [Asparagus officinalis]|uniref:chitinase n=1 Tax=Asparagus officinalis TaxID=4686 RepID=A0A5P1FNP1_ASPOF|nr:uncharacterized protein A4U43_C01F10780 [Asparagus officinalis]